VRRFEVEGRASLERVSLQLMYGRYDPQPQLGFVNRREGILGTTTVRLNANWVATGALRYDLFNSKVDQTQIGLGYIDDCLILALNYITS